MDTRPVVFLDSGIGGFPYCANFHSRNQDESLIYIADRVNFPYGIKNKHEIQQILLNLVERLIKKTDPKLAVLACNTATVSALDVLRENFVSLPFVGTVPAIKPAVHASKTKIIGLLGTDQTVNDAYITELANNSGPCTIHKIAAPLLVEFVEKRLDAATLSEKTAAVRRYLDELRALRADALVLGCTHFLYLADEFRREALPDIQVFDSFEGVTRRIEQVLDEEDGKLRSIPGYSADKLVLLTGTETPDSAWLKRTVDKGFKLSLLEDL